MRGVRAFAVGVGAGVLVAGVAAAGYVAFDHVSHRTGGVAAESPAASASALPSLASSPSAKPASPSSGDDQYTKQTLLSWQDSGADPAQMKPQVMDAAATYFARQTGQDDKKLRQKIVALNAPEYNTKSVSYCEDASDIRSTTEAWLLDIRADTLFVNEGFVSTTKQSAVDLFFRYTIGLYNLAPELKAYPNGVKSSDGTTAYFEKGLILLGRRTLDQLVNTSCYLPYRRPIQEGFTADRALRLLARLGLAPAADYAYPQKASLERFRTSIAPRLGSTADELVEPFLKTDSGEFYRRVGRALGSGADPGASQAAADKLFRDVFPPS